MRKTARALILKDKKVLLVSGYGADFFWTPGGGIGPDETATEAVARELTEELGIRSAKYKHFVDYSIDDQDVSNYLVVTTDEIRPRAEIDRIVWASKEDILNNTVNVSKGFRKMAFQELVRQHLL